MPLDIKKEIGTEWTEFLNLEDQDCDICDVIERKINFYYDNHKKYSCSPNLNLIFNAFKKCNIQKKNIKLVFVGNNPYFDNRKANGMCFSTKNEDSTHTIDGLKILLENKSLNCDFTKYANDGILFLNTSLTSVVEWEEYTKARNQKKRIDAVETYSIWEPFLKRTLTELNKYKDITFVFWGPQAEHLCDMLEMKNQLNVICSIHPDKVTSTTNVGIFSTKDPTYGMLVKKIQNYFI